MTLARNARKFSLTLRDFASTEFSGNDQQHTTLYYKMKQYILCSIYPSFIGFRCRGWERKRENKTAATTSLIDTIIVFHLRSFFCFTYIVKVFVDRWALWVI